MSSINRIPQSSNGRRDKKAITVADIKRTLEENEIEFSTEEINELMSEADPNGTGSIPYDTFLKLCILFIILMSINNNSI